MFRTIIVRSDLARQTLRKAVRTNSVRSVSAECAKRRPQSREKSLLCASKPRQQWQYQVVRHYAKEYPSHNRVLLPALSPTMEMGTIVSWDKKEGDKLNEGDLLAEIETDKATMGFETPEEGYLAKILVASGTKEVPIGKLVCIIVENKEDVDSFKDYVDDGGAAAPPPPKAAAAAPQPSTSQSPPQSVAPPQAAAAAASHHGDDRVYASPMAKRLAEQRNIRLQGKGSGLYDSITSKDLDGMGAAAPPGAAPRGPAPPAPTPAPGQAYIDIPITGMRSTIAKRLLQSKNTIPEYFVSTDVNVDNVMAIRTRLNKKMEKDGVKVSLNDFIIKAAAMASKQVPEVNAFWMDTVIRQQTNVDVSVAVSTDTGLITPIIFEANIKGVVAISKDMKALAVKARDGKLQPKEFQGGSLSISNLGMFGVTNFTAIINPPQSAILAVGTTQQKLVPDEKNEKGYKVVNYLSVSLTCDHRVIDGALGAKWLVRFRENLEDPVNMIL